ncbi:hypothetical protein NFI96_032783 [Prochilodus magdalenae]|nr:hypothetical protein NFI96_032783 [Prochilodus magdalenae]
MCSCFFMTDFFFVCFKLEPYMDENFVSCAFATMGELVVSVRIVRNRINLDAAGYCFVELADEATAERCLRKVNGKLVPGTAPPKRFKLNRATYGKQGDNRNRSGSFDNRYLDSNSYAPYQYYQQYSNPDYYSSWGYDQSTGSYNDYRYTSYDYQCATVKSFFPFTFEAYGDTNEDSGLEEPTVDLDVVAVNRQFMEDSEEFYDAIMDCHWPALDVPLDDAL